MGTEGGQEEGVGAGGTTGVSDDNDDGAGTSTAFDWLDFRLRFGCQERVHSFWCCAHVWRGGGGREPLSSSRVWCRALMVLSFFIPSTPFLFPLSTPVRSHDAPQVTGLFRTQLEDGIMGMDNRKGAFWLQLHEHYKRTMGEMEEDDKGEREEEDGPSFDPSRFSLC